MKNHFAYWLILVWLCFDDPVVAQEQRAPTAAVEGIKGVKEDAVEKIKNVETGNAADSGGVATGTANSAQGVNKISGVKTDGRTAVPPVSPVAPPPVSPVAPPPVNPVAAPPVNPVAPPPVSPVAPPPVNPVAPPPVKPVAPPVVSAGGTAVPAGGGSVGSAANIRAIKGVSGINSAKLQNLEKALILKEGGGGTPVGVGAENGGKGKAAAAALLGSPLEKKAGPKEDGRAGFQEFEKLQNSGS